MFDWLLFALTSVVAYVFITMFGVLGGGAGTSIVSAALDTFKPIPFILLLLGNVVWGVAIYLGLRQTTDAIPIAIVIGVVVSFLYDVMFMQTAVTWMHMLGLVLVLVGIYLLK